MDFIVGSVCQTSVIRSGNDSEIRYLNVCLDSCLWRKYRRGTNLATGEGNFATEGPGRWSVLVGDQIFGSKSPLMCTAAPFGIVADSTLASMFDFEVLVGPSPTSIAVRSRPPLPREGDPFIRFPDAENSPTYREAIFNVAHLIGYHILDGSRDGRKIWITTVAGAAISRDTPTQTSLSIETVGGRAFLVFRRATVTWPVAIFVLDRVESVGEWPASARTQVVPSGQLL